MIFREYTGIYPFRLLKYAVFSKDHLKAAFVHLQGKPKGIVLVFVGMDDRTEEAFDGDADAALEVAANYIASYEGEKSSHA